MDEALKIAIDLLHMPSRVRHVKSEPLPREMLTLLRIAAGEEDAIVGAVATADRPQHVIEDAASFFIEQILFNPKSDSYRVLGGGPDSTNIELRRNMALLLRWVHPDLDRLGSRASFATRVSRAWDDLKTPERRQAYDAVLANGTKANGSGEKRPRSSSGPAGPVLPAARRPAIHRTVPRMGLIRRTFALLFPKN